MYRIDTFNINNNNIGENSIIVKTNIYVKENINPTFFFRPKSLSKQE